MVSTVTSRSPRLLELSTGIPCSRSRKVVPFWVPAGMVYRTGSFRVGTTISPPMAMVVKGTCISISRLLPLRVNCLWGLTVTVTYRLPLGPPLKPASPWPRMLMVCPSSMPAGTFKKIRVFLRTRPLPRHSGQGSLMYFPVPPQAEQGREVVKAPKGVFCWVRT